MQVHTTSQFISSLRRFFARGEQKWKGDLLITQALIAYFTRGLKNKEIPDYGPETGLSFTAYLAKYLDDAWEYLRTSKDGTWFRQDFEKELGREVPDLNDISGGVDRTLTIANLGSLMQTIIGTEWAKQWVEKYFFAQDQVLALHFQKFVRQVYNDGMREQIDASKSSGMSGTFGKVELRTFITAGRIMMTFAFRPGVLQATEESITFIGEEDEKPGKRFGIQSVHTNLVNAIQMIDAVIHHWPKSSDPEHDYKRKELLTDNSNVCVG